MVISELIVELQKIQEKEGDLLVDISAEYDCGYGTAGANVDEIKVVDEVYREEYNENTHHLDLNKYKAVQLISYEC